MRRVGIAIVVGVLGLSGCGGSGNGTSTTRTSAAAAQRARLESQLRAGLEAPSSPVARVRDLDECVVEQTRRLPLSSLRVLVSSQQFAVAAPLLAPCVAEGKGLPWVRGEIDQAVAGKISPDIPAVYRRCVVAGVDELTPAQLAAVIKHGLSGDEAYSRQLGRRIGLACLHKPAVFAPFRKTWVDGVRHSLQGLHLPASFSQCVLNKAGQIGPAQLIQLSQASQAARTAYGQKLGRQCRGAVGG